MPSSLGAEGWIGTDEWHAYSVSIARPVAYRLEARVASLFSNKSFHLELNGRDITGGIKVPFTDGWHVWTTRMAGAISLLGAALAGAQTGGTPVTGKVQDEFGVPMKGCVVSLAGTAASDTTDIQGQFEVVRPPSGIVGKGRAAWDGNPWAEFSSRVSGTRGAGTPPE